MQYPDNHDWCTYMRNIPCSSFVLCAVKVPYNEFDANLPVAKRVQHLMRKVRDAVAEDSQPCSGTCLLYTSDAADE